MQRAVFSLLLLLGLASTAPISNDDNKMVITKDFFDDEFKIYEGQHDIVKIYVPLNTLNFEDSESSEADAFTQKDMKVTLFFVEADIKDGKTTDQGLYIRKNGKVTKLLDKGRDVTAPNNETKAAYFAAKDGIYSYNDEKNKAEKYGTIDDELIGIESGDTSNYFYILTANKEVYKVTEQGTKKVKVDDVKDAEQIVLDFDESTNSENLFYVNSEKKIFLVNSDGVKDFSEGLPSNPSKVTLVRPPFMMDRGSIPAIVGKKVYTLYANGTVENDSIYLDAVPTAYSMEATLIQYYAYNKKIYEYNILSLIADTLNELSKKLNKYLEDVNEIQNIASRSRSQFRRA